MREERERGERAREPSRLGGPRDGVWCKRARVRRCGASMTAAFAIAVDHSVGEYHYIDISLARIEACMTADQRYLPYLIHLSNRLQLL